MSAVLTSTVEASIAALQEDYELDIQHTGDGGAFVVVRGVEIGQRWSPTLVDIEFLIPYNYPFAAIYPYYTNGELRRVDGADWPTALQRVQWRERAVTQISLRATRWDPHVDTAPGAIAQVAHWFTSTS